MLSILRQGQKWLLWVIIIGVGGVFVFTFGIGGGGPAPGARNNTAVQVLDRSYTTRDFARLRDGQIEELREEYGQYIDEMAQSGQFDKYAVDSLIRSGVLASEAERLGIVVSDAEVREFLRSLPGVVNDEGEIDEEAVTSFAEREYGTLRRLQERLRDELLTSKLSRLIRQTASVTRQEAIASLVYAQEEVDIAWVGFNPKDLADVLHFNDVEIADFVEKETDQIAAAYEERHSEFNRPEEVALRHILIAKNDISDPDQTQSRETIQKAAERILSGESFEQVAKDVSMDQGTKDQGGFLGTFGREGMLPEFAEVAFDLEVGMVSKQIETSYGLHLIRVDGRTPARVIPLKEAQTVLGSEMLKMENAKLLAEKLSDELLSAVKTGKSLTDVVREKGLTLERPDSLRRGSSIDGLDLATEITETIFTNDLIGNIERIFKIGDERILVEILDRRAPEIASLENSLDEAANRLLGDRRALLESTWVYDLRSSLQEEGNLFVSPAVLNP